MKFAHTKKFFIFLEIATLALVFPFATSAQADTTGNTGLTFVINPYVGGLAIAVPASGAFSAISTPETNTIVILNLETVTVTDSRRLLGGLGAWTTTAQATNLQSSTDTITANTFSYASGIHVQSGGTVSVTAISRSALDSPVMVESANTGTGNHIVSWRPTLTVPVNALKAPGTYFGVITHSVS